MIGIEQQLDVAGDVERFGRLRIAAVRADQAIGAVGGGFEEEEIRSQRDGTLRYRSGHDVLPP
ncbi:MAG: hypothetical protein PGN09_03380 [Sphingomonas fennica]